MNICANAPHGLRHIGIGDFVVVEKVFFFKQKTAYEIVSRDWSSDVCSSDLQCFSV